MKLNDMEKKLQYDFYWNKNAAGKLCSVCAVSLFNVHEIQMSHTSDLLA